MMLYVCKDSFNKAHLNDTGSCISTSIVPSPIEECLRSMPMYAWAAGGVVSNDIILVLAYHTSSKKNQYLLPKMLL